MPRHLQGKTRMPLAGGCYSAGHRLALISLLPVLEARPGDRDDGERSKLALYQESLIKAGQPHAFALHEPSLYRWGAYLKSRRARYLQETDAGVAAASDALDRHALGRAIGAVLGADDE